MASTAEFLIPEDIDHWVALWEACKLKGQTLSSFGNLASGSKINVDQFILFRALWPQLEKPRQFKAAAGIQERHWTKAEEILKNSTSFQKWPGAFASVRRHQEVICYDEKKRKAGAVPETRVSRRRAAARGNISGFYSEETGLEGIAPSGGWQGRRPATSIVLHPTTSDEAIVNVHLVLLLQELINLERSSTIECTINRVRFVPKFDTNSFTTVVDGVVQSRRTKQILSILEVKPMIRYADAASVQMQETAEAIGWLQKQTNGVPELKDKSRLIIYQGRHEVFVTLMTPGTRYLEYLASTAPSMPEPETFVQMTTFGPWWIQKRPDLEDVCLALLAFLSAAEEVAA